MIGDLSGAVSAQETHDEEVEITIVKPNGTPDIISAFTLADLSYSVEYTADQTGVYTAKAHIGEDGMYQEADSNEVTFSVGKAPRTITLSWTPK